MLVRSSMALAIVMAGIGLGAVLGAAADPEMKQPPAQPWRAALQTPFTATAEPPSVDVWPADLRRYRDSYAPSWAHEELADWEPDYPAWTYGDLVDESLAEPAAADKHPVPEPEAPSPPEALASPEAEAPPPEPHGAGNLAPLY